MIKKLNSIIVAPAGAGCRGFTEARTLSRKGEVSGFSANGWVANESGSGDPVDSTGIGNTPNARNNSQQDIDPLLAVLGQLDNIYTQAQNAISDYVSHIKARPNPLGVTSSPKNYKNTVAKNGNAVDQRLSRLTSKIVHFQESK